MLSNEFVAVVTGGSRGIGRAIVLELVRNGATVLVNFAKSEKEARELEEMVAKDDRGRVLLCRFDVSKGAEVEERLGEAVEKLGRCDLLVNNAGCTDDALILRMGEAQWKRVMEVNVDGAFHCSRVVTKKMVRQRQGIIVNISSVVGQMGNAGQVNYAASKAALIGLTKTLARELASRNIRVNAIAPGFIESEMTARLSEQQKKMVLSQIPLAKFGTPEQIASLVLFLASPQADYITGQVIGINGGLYM